MLPEHRLMRILVAVTVVGTASLSLVLFGASADGVAASDAASSEVVATIGDYSITKSELKQRLLQAVRPQREDDGVPARSVTAESVLKDMLAEKAMIMEGRALGHLEDETLSRPLERNRQRRVIQMLLTDYVDQRVSVTPEQIDERLEANPQLTREQARRLVQTPQVSSVLQAFYAELCEKYEVEKVEKNFAEAARIHQRLLTQPAAPRGQTVYWITNNQVQNELTEAEKELVLIKYEGGRLTLLDWFEALCDLAPPGRPRDLNTAAGVERLADNALQPFILAAEARARGYDKNEEFLQYARQIEDMQLLGKVQSDKLSEMTTPSDDEIKAYFEEHSELFDIPASIRVDQIWCKDLETAREAKRMLDDGASWESVQSTHSLVEDSRAHNTYPNSEGPFWNDLWQAEPNDVVGPIRGFYAGEITWRVVKVLEKTPSRPQSYSDSLRSRVESAIYTLRRRELLDAYGAQLLEKYPHTIHADRIEDIDPLEVTATDSN